jgi:predicted metal-dependent hydrolase
MSEVLTIGSVEVLLRRSDRRRTVGLTLERDGSIVATAPTDLPTGDVSTILRSREVWIHSALSRRGAIKAAAPKKEYVSGEGFHYLGRTYRLRVIRGSATDGQQLPELRLFQGRFYLHADHVPHGREWFIRWYTERMNDWLAEKMPHLQRRVGVEVNGTAVMDLGFRWGSCSHAGRLNFHWRVVLLPPPMISYLTLHELCHLVEHNHTEKFWALVRRVDHDFDKKEAWLRENGAGYSL